MLEIGKCIALCPYVVNNSHCKLDGWGMPCVMTVDSNATTGCPAVNACWTSLLTTLIFWVAINIR